MKRLGLISTIGLALAGGLGLLLATADDQELASVDLRHPTTLLAVVTSRLHALQSYVRDFRVSDRIDAATAGFRETVQKHESPKQPLER
jgi:hypothetical protein